MIVRGKRITKFLFIIASIFGVCIIATKYFKVINKVDNIAISVYRVNNKYQNVDYLDEKVITFSFKYKNDKDMMIEIKQQGASRLPNIGAFYTIDNEEKKVSSELSNNKELYMDMYSDSLMPYKVYATEFSTNKRTESNEEWTGGWHGAVGTTFDLPSSAKNIKFDLYINGKLIEENTEKPIICKEAIVVIENYIAAYNTIDIQNGYEGNTIPVLKETQTLKLTSGNIEVSTEVEALESVKIKTMYGLAMNINNMGKDATIKYIGTDDESEKVAINEQGETYLHNSGVYSDNSKCNTVQVTDEVNGNVMEVYLDNNIGLGNYENIGTNTPMAFTTKYKKIYFNLVNDKDLILNKGEKINFLGGWKIYNKSYTN